MLLVEARGIVDGREEASKTARCKGERTKERGATGMLSGRDGLDELQQAKETVTAACTERRAKRRTREGASKGGDNRNEIGCVDSCAAGETKADVTATGLQVPVCAVTTTR